MARKMIYGELSRICGGDNAILGYEIDTETNKVTYTLRTYRRGVGATSREFDTYAAASEAFADFGEATRGGADRTANDGR